MLGPGMPAPDELPRDPVRRRRAGRRHLHLGARRAPLQQIVLALARRRIDAPGEALALAELLAAGWPGERVGDSASTNRVHVALSTLRNLGLRGVLVSGRDGHALTSASPYALGGDD